MYVHATCRATWIRQPRMKVKFHRTEIEGAWLLEPEPRADPRGHFARLFCAEEFAAQGLESRFVQVNSGVSPRAGTLRGLHYQVAPHAEVKIVRCVCGAVFDAIVDLREGSASFGRWLGYELDAASSRMLYVPTGCAHGYLTLAADTELLYFTSSAYAPQAATGVRYDDPAIGIRWPIPVQILSDADAAWPGLAGRRR
jgi:dTDP-4-dehydrorhamnose 3,5-epimerase